MINQTSSFHQKLQNRKRYILEMVTLFPSLKVSEIAEGLRESSRTVERAIQDMSYLSHRNSKKMSAQWVVSWQESPYTREWTERHARRDWAESIFEVPHFYQHIYSSLLPSGESPENLTVRHKQLYGMRMKKIAELMIDSPSITLTAISNKIDLSVPTVERMVSIMPFIHRSGSRGYGCWKVDQDEIPIWISQAYEDRPFRKTGKRLETEEREEKLLALLLIHPSFTQEELAAKLSVSQRTVSRMMAGLRVRNVEAEGDYTVAGKPAEDFIIIDNERLREKTVRRAHDLILALLEDPFITIPAMAEKTDLSVSTVNLLLKKMPGVTRIGSRKTGHWSVSDIEENEYSLLQITEPASSSLKKEYDRRASLIIKMIKNNPHISLTEMCGQLGIHKSTLVRQLKRMNIHHAGSRKGGYWMIHSR